MDAQLFKQMLHFTPYQCLPNKYLLDPTESRNPVFTKSLNLTPSLQFHYIYLLNFSSILNHCNALKYPLCLRGCILCAHECSLSFLDSMSTIYSMPSLVPCVSLLPTYTTGHTHKGALHWCPTWQRLLLLCLSLPVLRCSARCQGHQDSCCACVSCGCC